MGDQKRKVNSELVKRVRVTANHLSTEECFAYGGKYWKLNTLWNESEKYKPQKISVEGIDVTNCFGDYPLNNKCTEEIYINHLGFWKRVYDANLSYPIILTPLGVIADGRHRVLKSIIEGKSHVWVIKLLKMPKPDGIMK